MPESTSDLRLDSPQHLLKLFVQQSPKGLITLGKKKAKKLLCLSEKYLHVYDFTKLDLDTCLPIDSIVDWKIGNQNIESGSKCEVTINYSVKASGKASKKSSISFTCWQVPLLMTILSSRMSWIRGLTQADTSFFVRKWTKANQHVEYTLKFYGARIYKFDNTTNQPLSYIDMKDIKQLSLVKEKPDAIVIFSSGYYMRYYSTNNVKSLLLSIQKHLKQLLNYNQPSIIQERSYQEIVEFRDFQKILNDNDSSVFSCEHKVDRLKIVPGSKTSTVRSRRLKINSKFIVELNEQNLISSIHRTVDVESIIRSSKKDQEFTIVYSTGEKYTYLSNMREKILLNILEMRRKWKVSQGTNSDDNLYSGTAISSLLQLIQLDLLFSGQREGASGSPPHSTYSEALLKKVCEKQGTLAQIINVVGEFNQSFNVGEIPAKEKKLLSVFLSILKSCLNEESLDDSIEKIQAVLFAISRCMSCKTLFEDLTSTKGINELVIQICFKNINDSGIRFQATTLMLQMISSEHSTSISEKHMSGLVTRETIDLFLAHIEKASRDPTDCLCIHNILCIFSVLLHSSASQVKDAANYLLARLFESQNTCQLFFLSRHDAISISLLSTTLLSSMLVVSTGLQYELLQKEILVSGLLIKQVYQALFSKDSDVCEAAKRFIDLSVSYFEESENVMRKIIPKPLFPTIPQEIKESTHKPTKGGVSMKVGLLKETPSLESKCRGWYNALKCVSQDFSNAACIWNDQTRQDLEESLLSQIRALDEAEVFYSGSNEKFVWNYKEYETDFKSLQPYEMVNGYFLGYLENSDQPNEIEIDDPEALVKELYYKLILTNDNSSRMQYIRAISRIYVSKLSTKNIPFPHLDYLVKVLSSELYPQEVIMEMINLVHAIMTVEVNRNLVNQYCVPMLVHFVRKIHCATSHDLRAAKICLSVLKHLSTFRVKSLDESQIVCPLPIAVREMSNRDSFAHLVQCILSAPPILKRTTLQLILHLININKKIIPSIHTTGIYYFIFASMDGKSQKGSEESHQSDAGNDIFISLEAVQILQTTCRAQLFQPETFGLQPGENILSTMLPISIIHQLMKLPAPDFQKLFNTNTKTEAIIWNNSMRTYLQKCANEHIKTFVDELRAKEGATFYHHAPISKIVYKELENQPFVAGLYLKNITPNYLTTLGDEERQTLFWRVVDAFKATEINEEIIYFLAPQKDILRLQDSIVKEKVYSGFGKLVAVLTASEQKLNLHHVDVVSEIIHLMMVDGKNIGLAIQRNIPSFLCQILGKIFSLRESQNRLDAESQNNVQICDRIISRTFSLLSKIAASPFVKGIMETNPDVCTLLIRSIHAIDQPSVLKTFGDFIISLCRTENITFLKNLWSIGFPLLTMSIMLSVPENEANGKSKAPKFNKAAIITIPLAILIASSLKLFPDRDNYILKDLNLILPYEIIYKLRLLGLNSNERVNSILEILHGEWEEPGIVWTKEMRKQLHSYVSKSVSLLAEEKFSNPINVVYMDYEDKQKYLNLGNVFVDIYIDNKWDSWQPRDFTHFAGELIEYLSDTDSKKVNNIRNTISACHCLLRRTIQQNRNAFNDMVKDTFAGEKGIHNIYQLFTLGKYILDVNSYSNIFNIVTLCFEADLYKERICTTSRVQVHNIIYAFDYAAANIQPFIHQTMSLLKTYFMCDPLYREIETNGILLYLLLIFSGAFDCASDEDRKEAAALISELCNKDVEMRNAGQSCTFNLLRSLLPLPICEKFITTNPSEILTFFESKHRQPNIVWNKDTRTEFREYLHKQKEYMKSNKQWTVAKNFKLEYKSQHGLMIGDILVRLYNEQPDFPLQYPDRFLVSLCHAVTITKDMSVVQDLLMAMRNVFDYSKSIGKSLATHPCLDEIASYILKIVGDMNATMATSSLSLQIVYEILSNGNKTFLANCNNNVENFMKGFFSHVDLQELFLVVFLAISQQDDIYVKMLLDLDIVSHCIDIMEERKRSSIALRAAQLIKYFVTSPTFGEKVLSSLQDGHVEIWNQYREIQLPPPNMPLAESLKSLN